MSRVIPSACAANVTLPPTSAQGLHDKVVFLAAKRRARGIRCIVAVTLQSRRLAQAEIVRPYPLADGQQRRLLQYIAKLTDIAWPGMPANGLDCTGIKPQIRPSVTQAVFRQKMLGKQHDVVVTRAQRRYGERYRSQPVHQVLPEFSSADTFLERRIRRRDEAHIDRPIARAADRAHAAVLQHLEHLGLRRRRQLRDFIQEQRAAISGQDQTGATFLGVGEGAALMPEQFRFDELRRQRRAVDLDKWLRMARALEMQRPCDEFLACPGFAGDQHGWRRTAQLTRFHCQHLGDLSLQLDDWR